MPYGSIWVGLFLCVLGGCEVGPDPLADDGQRHDTIAGIHGEPPRELKVFNPPIELVEAWGYLDGGTKFVALRDADGYSLTFCVPPEDCPPALANSLLIGCTVPTEPAARFPLSEAEAKLVVRSLDAAIETARTNYREKSALLDPAKDGEDGPISRSLSQAEWRLRYAETALKWLQQRKSVPLANHQEVSQRIRRLASVDLEKAAKAFRDGAGGDRRSEWKQLEPVLAGAFRHPRQKHDIAAHLLRLLGPPDPTALEHFAGMVSDPFADPTPIASDVYAYVLNDQGGRIDVVVADFRHPGGVRFQGFGGTSPKKKGP